MIYKILVGFSSCNKWCRWRQKAQHHAGAESGRKRAEPLVMQILIYVKIWFLNDFMQSETCYDMLWDWRAYGCGFAILVCFFRGGCDWYIRLQNGLNGFAVLKSYTHGACVCVCDPNMMINIYNIFSLLNCSSNTNIYFLFDFVALALSCYANSPCTSAVIWWF